MRSEEWWRSLQPFIETFWEDVEKAKRGEFTIPDSTRLTKRVREDPCQIVFHREGAENTIVQEPPAETTVQEASQEAPQDMKIVFLQ